MSVQSRVELLERSLAARGLPTPRPPRDVEILDTIRRAIEPFRLPADVVRFWELVDPGTIAVRPWPWLTSPAFALQSWRAHAEEPGMVPEVLFPIAYESHLFTFVELHSPDADTGGALWWYGYTDEEFRLWFAGINGLLTEMANALDRGDFERRGDWARIIDPDDTGPPITPEAPHPIFGAIDSIPVLPEAWPQPWRDASALYHRHRAPLGASHTIAEVLAGSASTPVRGRIHAMVERVVHIAGQGVAVVVSDATGSLRVWYRPRSGRQGSRFAAASSSTSSRLQTHHPRWRRRRCSRRSDYPMPRASRQDGSPPRLPPPMLLRTTSDRSPRRGTATDVGRSGRTNERP